MLTVIRTLGGRLLGLARLSAFIPGGGVLVAGASVVSGALGFFSTPLGRWVGVALIGAGLYVVGDLHRAHLDHAKWTAAVQEADKARAARDAAIRQEVTASAQARTAEIQREADELKQRVTDYENAPATGGDCRATPDHARRLRGL